MILTTGTNDGYGIFHIDTVSSINHIYFYKTLIIPKNILNTILRIENTCAQFQSCSVLCSNMYIEQKQKSHQANIYIDYKRKLITEQYSQIQWNKIPLNNVLHILEKAKISKEELTDGRTLIEWNKCLEHLLADKNKHLESEKKTQLDLEAISLEVSNIGNSIREYFKTASARQIMEARMTETEKNLNKMTETEKVKYLLDISEKEKLNKEISEKERLNK